MPEPVLRLVALLVLLLPFPALAQVEVTGAWSRALPPVSANGAAWLRLHNAGADADRLLEISSPMARMVHVHETRIESGVATMGMVDALRLAPGEEVLLAPGGLHLMLMGLVSPLVEGGTLPLTLRFERAGEIEVAVPVLAPDASGPP